MAVAKWPIVATAQPGPRDPDDSAKENQQVRAGGGGPCHGLQTSCHGAGISQETFDNRGLAVSWRERQNPEIAESSVVLPSQPLEPQLKEDVYGRQSLVPSVHPKTWSGPARTDSGRPCCACTYDEQRAGDGQRGRHAAVRRDRQHSHAARQREYQRRRAISSLLSGRHDVL